MTNLDYILDFLGWMLLALSLVIASVFFYNYLQQGNHLTYGLVFLAAAVGFCPKLKLPIPLTIVLASILLVIT